MTKRTRTTEGSNQQPALFDTRYISNATSTYEALAQNETDHSPSSSSSSPLENLPVQIRQHILESSLDLQSLRNLTKASPTFYGQYKASEKSILQLNLRREMDGFVVDAVATVNSGKICQGSNLDSVTNIDITNFFVSYEEELEEADSSDPFAGVSLESTRLLLRYHLTTVVPLSKELANQAMTNFSSSIPNETSSLDQALAHGVELSLQERWRLMQAIYRIETYYNLFGNRIYRYQFARASFVAKEVLPLFKPWGVEAMACVEVLAKQFLKNTIQQVNESQFTDSDGPHLISETERDDFVHGIIGVGLDTLALFYRVRSDTPLLISSIKNYTVMRDAQDLHFMSMIRYAEGVEGDEAVLPRYVRQSEQVPLGMSEVSWSKCDAIRDNWVPETFRSWGYAIWGSHRWADVEKRLGFLGTVWVDAARDQGRLRYEV